MTIDIESTNGDQRWSIMIHLSLKLKPLRPLSVGPHISDRDVECVSRVRPGSDASHPKTHSRLALKRCISMFEVIHTNHPLPPPKKKHRVWNRPFWLWIPAHKLLLLQLSTWVFHPQKIPKRKFPQLKGEESPNTIRAKIPDVSSNFVAFFLGEFLTTNKIHTAPQPFPSLKTLAHSI